MIRRVFDVLARFAGSDAATALAAQHAGHADLHDVLIALGVVGCLVLAAFRRR